MKSLTLKSRIALGQTAFLAGLLLLAVFFGLVPDQTDASLGRTPEMGEIGDAIPSAGSTRMVGYRSQRLLSAFLFHTGVKLRDILRVSG